MKKARQVFWLFLLAAALMVMVQTDNKLLAVTGCCMERNTYRENWRPHPQFRYDFPNCKRLNEQRDRDNVFDQRGLVWWNVNCR